jgi:hypothetical protein
LPSVTQETDTAEHSRAATGTYASTVSAIACADPRGGN